MQQGQQTTIPPPKYHETFQGLLKWYDHVFEKLGCILLAYKDASVNRKYQVEGYILDIGHLIEAIEERKKTIGDEDKQADLKTLRENLGVLQDHVRSVFPPILASEKGPQQLPPPPPSSQKQQQVKKPQQQQTKKQQAAAVPRTQAQV
jgi:hypothetical protein